MPAPTAAGRRSSWTHHSAQRKKWLHSAIRVAAGALAIAYLLLVTIFHASKSSPADSEAVASTDPGTGAVVVQGRGLSAPPEQRKVIAYAISVTADGPYMDGAAVLAYAIKKFSAESQYGLDLIAIVYPTVNSSRGPLVRAGWR